MNRLPLIVVLVAALGPATFAADPPALVNYQGVLRDEADRPRKGVFDMVFRFMSLDTGGVEIMVDSHTAAGGNAVAVAGGLFNVQLGGGTVSDGSGAGVYTSLADVFRDYGTVWLAIRVGDEDLLPRVRIISAAYALNARNAVNAANLDGNPSSSYLDTSAVAQTKNSQLSITNGSPYGINAAGSTAGGYFQDAGNSGYAYVGYGDNGISGYGNLRGGYFADLDGSGYMSAGYGEYGITAYGNTAGGYFKDRDGTAYAYVGYGDYGISARGPDSGAYFGDADGTGYARLGRDDHGLEAFGEAAGGYFTTGEGWGWAVDAHGGYGGGQFGDLTETGYAKVAYGDIGLWAEGSVAGASFKDTDNTATATMASGYIGVTGYGRNQGGYFTDNDQSGYAFAGYGDTGLCGRGDEMGGEFTDLTSWNYANLAQGSYKIYGTGAVSFVQNHPFEKDKVIVYAAPEGDEVAVYTRGTARLAGGEARVALGPTFRWVTNPDVGLTAHLTPVGAWSDLYVAEKSTAELVVRSREGAEDVLFDYIVYGLRIGFEESSIIQHKKRESFIPSMHDHRELYASDPELRSYSAVERFKTMSAQAGLAVADDMPAAASLKSAVHEYDVATDGPYEQRPAADPLIEGHREDSPPRAESAARQDTKTAREPLVERGAPRTLLPVSEPVEAGDLLALDPLRPGGLAKSRAAGDPLAVAIAAAPSEELAGALTVPVCDTIYGLVKA
ncbi:MAG: hypothetical protein KBD01_17795, partial [Acidobacteria bacterium]|nr:hypothetical protein [Acidobacteriota bacterium]